jgi:hypothetical protein
MAAEAPVPGRILTRVLMSCGKPIDRFADPVELLPAMRDAVCGPLSLLIDGHILHRDISVNNIMISIATVRAPTAFTASLLTSTTPSVRILSVATALSPSARGQSSS